MALFKICRGNESNLPTTLTDGYAYFCTDTGNFYIDWADSDGNVSREHISAEYATKLRYKNDNGEWVEIDTKELANSAIRTTGIYDSLYQKIVGDTPVPISEKTIYFYPAADLGLYITSANERFGELLFGETYKVLWDDAEYTLECKSVYTATGGSFGTDSHNQLFVGNCTLIGNAGLGEDSEEPFVIYWNVDSGSCVVMTKDNASSHLVSVTPVNSVIKLDKKYLPDGLATEEFVAAEIAKFEESGGGSGGNGSGGVSSWNDLTDKPFWEEEISVMVTANTANQAVTFDGFGFTWCKGSDETLTKEEIIGASIEMCAGGQITPLPVSESDIMIANDNATVVLIAAYEFAFVMCYQASEVTITLLGTTETVNIPEPGLYLMSDMLSNMDDGDYLKICNTAVKKIDNQYQHQSDWTEDDRSSAAYILNKPFGVVLSAGTVVTDCTAFYEAADFGLLLFDMNTFEKHLNGSAVVEGGSYTANFGDHEYTGIGISAAEVTEIIGSASDGGIKFVDESGNHVCTLAVKAAGLYDCIPFVPEYQTLYADGESYPVKITVAKEVVKKIDTKYLPYPPEFDLTAMGLPALTLDGTEVLVECDTTELRAALDKGAVKMIFAANIGDRVTVSGVLNGMCIGGDYQCSFLGSFLTSPVLLNFTITASFISGKVYGLSTATIG